MRIHKDINLNGARVGKDNACRQRRTVNKLLSILEKQPGAILADEVGMGKTFVAIATALTYISHSEKDKRILVLTPSKELNDKWDKDIDTFRNYCIRSGSSLKKLASDRGVYTLGELFESRESIISIPLQRIAGSIKEEEKLCYLGAYFRKNGFGIESRRRMLKALKKAGCIRSIGNITDALILDPERWAFNQEKFWDYENIKKCHFKAFDETVYREDIKKFEKACRNIRMQILSGFSFCILDEAHNYKNPWTAGHRLFHDDTEALGGGLKHTIKNEFEKLLFLTATPFQLNYTELLHVFQMLIAAKSCTTDYADRLKKLENLLKAYSCATEEFENAWRTISLDPNKKHIMAKEADVYLKKGAGYASRKYIEVIAIKRELEYELKKMVIRNTKSKCHRDVWEGSCSIRGKGIVLPDKDKPLFFSLLRLEQEYERTKNGFGGLSDSMVTSSYTTFKDSKMMRVSYAKHLKNNRLIDKYHTLINHLLRRSDDGEHPKVNDIVDKVVERYFNGEKSLIFTFYINTAKTLRKSIKERIDHIREEKHGDIKIGGTRDKYIINTQRKFTSPHDIRYLAINENLLLTHYKSNFSKKTIVPTGVDWKKIANIMGKHGYFNSKKRDYRIMLRAFEHYFFIKMPRKNRVTDPIIYRVRKDDYVSYGLHPSDRSGKIDCLKKRGISDYKVCRKDVDNIKNSSAAAYILKGPNIWAYHKDSLRCIDDIRLRRKVKDYIIREITREDLILDKFIQARCDDENTRWIDIIDQIYREPLFHKILNPESLKDRVERWLKIISNKYQQVVKVNKGEALEHEKRRLIKVVGQLTEIKNDEDVREIHGGSKVDRSVYFEAFNSPFRPVVLICTSIGSEGIDLHKECSGVFLYDLGWNPAALEQKIGRVDRIGSKNERERKLPNIQTEPKIEVYKPFLKGTRDERMYLVVKNREKWFNFILGTANRLSKDENGDWIDNTQLKKEERMKELPDTIVKSLILDLGVTKDLAAILT